MEMPSKLLLSVEGIRSIYEYGLAWALHMPLQYIAPKGDGHPVMIIPGLGAADGSTYYLRNFIRSLGYRSYTWGQGRNLGPRQGLDNLLYDIHTRIEKIYHANNNQPVSLIGWSLGGIYSREVAKIDPSLIRQVITMGTPFKGTAASTNASFLYELLSKDTSHKDPNVLSKIVEPPPVPFTSIYSKSDGVVHWKSSLESLGPMTENIEIPGASHLGLGHNPISMYVIADRLTQNKYNWQPYKK